MLDIADLTVLMVLHHLTITNDLSGWHKYAKCGQLCVKKLKFSIFDQFLNFECLNMNIADYDRANGSGLFGKKKLPALVA